MKRSTILAFLAALAFSAITFAANVPRPAPSLELTDASGTHISLAKYRGKVVVVQFLLTTCPHCQRFSQLLDRLQAEYGPKGFQAIGAAVNEATPKMAADYHSQYAQAFPVAPYPEESVYTFMQLSVLDRPGFPQIAVIDRRGQIREQSSPRLEDQQPLQLEPHLRALVEKLLAEPAGPLSAARKK